MYVLTSFSFRWLSLFLSPCNFSLCVFIFQRHKSLFSFSSSSSLLAWVSIITVARGPHDMILHHPPTKPPPPLSRATAAGGGGGRALGQCRTRQQQQQPLPPISHLRLRTHSPSSSCSPTPAEFYASARVSSFSPPPPPPPPPQILFDQSSYLRPPAAAAHPLAAMEEAESESSNCPWPEK